MNIQRANNRPWKYMKQTFTELRGDMQSPIIRVESYGTTDWMDGTARCTRSNELKPSPQQ
jgi:hypothetical protein